MFSSQARYIPIAPIFLAIFCSTISQAQLEPAPTPLAQASETPASPHRPTIGVALAAAATLALGILPGGAISFAEYASHSTLIEQARQECAAHPEGCRIQLEFDVR